MAFAWIGMVRKREHPINFQQEASKAKRTVLRNVRQKEKVKRYMDVSTQRRRIKMGLVK